MMPRWALKELEVEALSGTWMFPLNLPSSLSSDNGCF